MERTNLTKQLAERNFERKYGLLSAIITCILLGLFLISFFK